MLYISEGLGYPRVLKNKITEIIEDDLKNDIDRADENFDITIKVKVRKGNCEVFFNAVDLND